MLIYQKHIAGAGLVLLLLLLLPGCQSIETYYRGYHAEGESVTTLAPIEQAQGTWRTFDLALNYSYGYADNLLKISGNIDLGLYYEMNTRRIERLNVFIFFLDDKSSVIQTAFLSSLISFDPQESLTFARKLKVPTGAYAIAFGYSGEARRDGEGGSDSDGRGGGGLDFFYDLPKRVKR